MNPTVIAVCGSSSGAGKSTLVRRLSEVIPNSVSLYFDAYHVTTSYPPNIYQDLTEGKQIDPGQIQSPDFYRDLLSLLEGRGVTDPWNRQLKPAKYILVEEPFGKLRTGMKEIIHYLVGIELPLDLAIARRILRNIRTDFSHLTPGERLNYVDSFLTEYLHGGRISYQKLFEAVKNDCDIVLNGLASIEQMTGEVLTKFKIEQ